MTSHLRQFLLALCSVLLIPSGGAAVTYNDLWWIPSESGWGTNIAQQGDTLFMTFFVYGTDSKPTWFVAQLARTGTSAAGQPVFTGKTYATTGPWYGGPFNAAAVTDREAGTISFAPSDTTSATVEYTVDGVTVRKSVQRQTLVSEDLSGTYKVLMNQTQSCPGLPTMTEIVVDDVVIQHASGQFRYVQGVPGDSCTLAGAWVQNGLIGSASGTLICDDGLNGTFNINGVATNALGFTATYSASGRMGNLTCTLTGTVSATRR